MYISRAAAAAVPAAAAAVDPGVIVDPDVAAVIAPAPAAACGADAAAAGQVGAQDDQEAEENLVDGFHWLLAGFALSMY
jgi:hypothetical protein